MSYIIRKSTEKTAGIYMLSVLDHSKLQTPEVFLKARYSQAVGRREKALKGEGTSIDGGGRFELSLYEYGIENWEVEDQHEIYETRKAATIARNNLVATNEESNSNERYIGHFHNIGTPGSSNSCPGFNKPLPQNITKKRFFEIIENVADVVGGISDTIRNKAYMAYMTKNSDNGYTINCGWTLYDFIKREKTAA